MPARTDRRCRTACGDGISCCAIKRALFIADFGNRPLAIIAPVASKVLELDKYRAKDMHESGYVRLTKRRETTLRTLLRCGLRARLLLRGSCSSIPSVSFTQRQAVATSSTTRFINLPSFTASQLIASKAQAHRLGTLRKAIASTVMSVSHAVSYASYIVLHKWLGVATEEARYTMPLSTATTFVMTAARADWDRVLTHRLSKDAQTDIQVLAGLIAEELGKINSICQL